MADEIFMNSRGNGVRISNSDVYTPATYVITPSSSGYKADFYTSGIADDIQIQAAINAIGSNGGSIYITEGTYNFSNSNINNYFTSSYAPFVGLTLKSNITIRGAGIGKTILNLASYNTGLNERFVMFCNTAAGQTQIEIADMTVQLPAFVTGGSAFWGSAIELAGASRVIVRNIRIINGGWRFDGNVLSFNSTTNQLTTDAQDILLENVQVAAELGSSALFSCRNVTVRDCIIRASADDPIIISNSGQQLKFINVYLEGNNTASGGAASGGFYFASNTVVTTSAYGMSDIEIIGCQIRNLQYGAGIYVAGTGGVRDIRIIGNIAISNAGNGIHLNQRIQNAKIIGNDVSYNLTASSDKGGIAITAVNASDYMKDIIVFGNNVVGNSTNGIYLKASTGMTVDGITISGNDIYDDQGTVTQTNGINISAGGIAMTNVILDLNNVRANTNNYLWTLGGGTIGGGSLYLVGGSLVYRGGANTTTTLGSA